MSNQIKQWIKAAGIRAIKTAAQAAIAMIPVGLGVHEVGWIGVVSVAAGAAVISVLTSIAGIPEVDGGASVPKIAKEG